MIYVENKREPQQVWVPRQTANLDAENYTGELQTKNYNITTNGTTVIEPDPQFAGISGGQINVNVAGGGGSYSAGTNIDITNNVISVTGITVPVRTSQLTNDSGYVTRTWVESKGYLTEHQDISGYWTSAQTANAITVATTNKVSSNTATEIWVGTQAEYDSIAIKSPTTIYLVK